MGPFYYPKRFQDSIPHSSPSINSSHSYESIFLPPVKRRSNKTSQKTGCGKGNQLENSGFYSCLRLVPKKNGKLRPVIDLSTLNQHIQPQPFKMETAKSIRQSILLKDWAVSIDLTNAYLHILIYRQSRKYLRFTFCQSGIPIQGTQSFGMSLSVDFHKTDGHYRGSSSSTLHLSLSFDDWLIKDLPRQKLISQTIVCLHTMQTLGFIPRKVRFDPISEIHPYRHGIPDPSQYRQSTTSSQGISALDRKSISDSHSRLGLNLPFSIGETQCCSRFSGSRSPSFISASDVPAVSVETPHTSLGSPNSNYKFDPLSPEMVDRSQPLYTGDQYSSTRSNVLPFYRCQSLRMGSSSRTDETILSWSLDRRPISTPHQYSGNNGHSFCIEKGHTLYTAHFCHNIDRQHNSSFVYQQTRRNPFTEPMYRSMGNPALVSETQHNAPNSRYTRQIQYFGGPALQIGQAHQHGMVLGSESC